MRWLRSLFLPVSVLIIGTAAFRVPLPVFLEIPGEAVSLNERVQVETAVDDLDGEFLLLTVNLRRGTVVRMGRAFVDPDIALVREGRLIPRGIPDRVYFARQRALFRQTAEIAAGVGMREAGVDVDPSAVTGDGVLVLRVLAGSPADGVLQPGDVIVAVDGEPVRLSEQLRRLVQDATGGRVFRLTVDREGDDRELDLAPGRIVTDQGEARGFGVEIETSNPRVQLPLDVEVEGGRIGGPSAGLMIALTVYDLLAEEDLLRGRLVAGTGGIDSEGRVGSIGGIPQKVLSAHGAAVDVLLVPADQADIAEAARPAGSDLRILPVVTVSQAIAALRGQAAVRAGAEPPVVA